MYVNKVTMGAAALVGTAGFVAASASPEGAVPLTVLGGAIFLGGQARQESFATRAGRTLSPDARRQGGVFAASMAVGALLGATVGHKLLFPDSPKG